MNQEHLMQPRRRASTDIRLLRLDLLPRGNTPCDQIGSEWSPAQPTESLSPEKAAAFLGVEIWEIQSLVRKRYRTLQLRYPPEQFSSKHIDWRPSAELLASPRARLNWYWQSGLIPLAWSEKADDKGILWDKSSAEPIIDAKTALDRSLKKALINLTP